MLPALISAIAAIWRKVVAEYPCRRNNFAAASRIKSRDFSDFEVWATSPGAFCFFAFGGSRFDLAAWGLEERLDLDWTRCGSPGTNRDRRVGFMFKAPSARDYWRSQKASSTARQVKQIRLTLHRMSGCDVRGRTPMEEDRCHSTEA